MPISPISVADAAKKYVGVDEEGRIADLDLRSRIARHSINAKALALTLVRAFEEAKGNQNPSATTSVMKNSGTWIGGGSTGVGSGWTAPSPNNCWVQKKGGQC